MNIKPLATVVGAGIAAIAITYIWITARGFGLYPTPCLITGIIAQGVIIAGGILLIYLGRNAQGTLCAEKGGTMLQITGKDIIAIVVIVTCAVLLATGIDTEVKSILALVTGYYFGTKLRRSRQGK